MLIVLAVGSAIGVTYWLGGEAAERGSDEALANSRSVQQFFQQRALRELELVSSLMAADRAFVSYISQALRDGGDTIDRRSIIDLLNERSDQYGFDFALVLDPDGRTLANTGDLVPVGGDLSGQPVVARVLNSFRIDSGLWVEGGTVLQVAVVPLLRGRTVEGIVVTGNRVTPERVAEIARVSSTDLAYIATGNEDPVVAVTTLAAAASDDLRRTIAVNGPLVQRVQSTGRFERAVFELAGEDWEAVVATLDGESEDGVLVSLVPQERLFAMFRRLGVLMLLAGGGALLLALIISVLAARGFTRPIKTLTRTADAAAGGEYPQRIESGSRGEIGQLERAFNCLVVELREQHAVENYFNDIWQRRSVNAYREEAAPAAGGPSGFRTYSAGDVLGRRYELLRFVGGGGMGVVYEAHDRELDEVVALKMLKPSMVNDPEKIGRLKTEIRLARRITHPNVVRTYDFAQIDDQAMISMEHVRGITLREAIDDHGRVNFHAAMRLARQICSGIAAAHRAGVLHRDIKPGNIIINYNAKVMDFGIANPASKPFTSRSENDTLEGTPEFMSPEQLSGQETDERSDLYSLGVVLMEMFTGRLPYTERDTMDTVAAHLEKTPPRPSLHWSDIPVALEALILRCLEKSPRDRFQTADELYDALQSLRES